MRLLNRRQFVVASSLGLAAATARAQGGPLTVQQVVDRIRAATPAPGRGSADGLKAGDASTVVTGVTITAMATLPVLQRAAAARQNLIVTLEPTFYALNDEPGARATDPVYLAKKKLIDDQHLAIYRISDQWNGRFAEFAAAEIAKTHGARPVAGAERIFDITETSLRDLAQKHASVGGLRVVGNLEMRVKRLFISPGGTTLQATMAGLKNADAAIVGEAREWEAIPYVLDALETAAPKGMIYLGRLVSENAALPGCANWLASVVPGLPAPAVTIVSPYWTAS